MAGRNRAPRYASNNAPRVYRDAPPRPVIVQGSRPPPHPAMLEEELGIQRENMRRITSDNRHFEEDILILRRELDTARDDIHRLSQIIPQVRADKELETRDLIQRGLKLESELRANEPLKSEVMKLRAEAEKVNGLRQELSVKVQALTNDLTRVQADNKQVALMRVEVEGMRKELLRAREAFEYEKKANMEQMEHKEVMEKNMISMARELEKLQAELSSAQRARALGPYGLLKGSSDLGYGGSAFGEGYGAGAWMRR